MTGVSSSGPLPQLPPKAWTPSASSAAAAASGETPIIVWPRVSKVIVAMIGIDGSAARTPSMAAVISARSDIVSIQMQSTPPAASEARLLGEAGHCLVVLERAERRHDQAARPDVAGHERRAAGRVDLGAQQDGGGPVQLVDAILVAREAEPEAIAAEGVGEQDAGTGVEVAAMDAAHDVRVGQVPDLRRIAELEAGLEEHRAHRAVGEDGATAVEERRESVGHRRVTHGDAWYATLGDDPDAARP